MVQFSIQFKCNNPYIIAIIKEIEKTLTIDHIKISLFHHFIKIYYYNIVI